MSILVGKKLSQARQEQGFTIAQVAEVTFIRLRFLEAMEAGKFDLIPSPVQARGFLRTYADFLKLDRQELLELLTQDPLSAVLSQSKEKESTSAATVEDTPPRPEKKSGVKLVSVGESLKNQREILGISLDDVERYTHVKKQHLQTLENGDFDAMPSMVQGSGMLKNYADFLGLDPEPLLLRFADSLQARLAERHPRDEKKQTSAAPAKKKRGTRRIFSRDILVGVLLLVFLVTFSVWAGMQISATRLAEEPVPTPPSIADVLLPSPTASPEPTITPTVLSPLEVITGEAGALALAATEAPLDAVLLEGAVQVQIAIHQRTWVRVTVDGEVAFDQRVIPGGAYAFAADEQVEILTGNGAGLDVTYNGTRFGTLGTFGQVVHIIITSNGILNPTPTISPTATITPRTTPTASSTPQP